MVNKYTRFYTETLWYGQRKTPYLDKYLHFMNPTFWKKIKYTKQSK